MNNELRALLRRLDRWKGAPDNGHEEEGYIDLICDVSDTLARMLGVSEAERATDTGFHYERVTTLDDLERLGIGPQQADGQKRTRKADRA